MAAGVFIALWFFREARRIYLYFRQSGKAKANPEDMAAQVNAWFIAAGGRVRVRDVYRKHGRRFGWSCAEMARTWLAEHFQAEGLATFERVGKSDWLVAVEPPPPEPDNDGGEDDGEPPVNVTSNRSASFEPTPPKARPFES